MINMVLGAKARASSGAARILLVALFIVLLLSGTTIGLLHVHPEGAGHTDCALCQTTHNIARPSVAPPIVPVVFVVIRVTLPRGREFSERIFCRSHWNRPPPEQTGVA